MLTDGAWEHLDVDVELKSGVTVIGDTANARDAVVLALVVGGDGEAVVKELGIGGHDGGCVVFEVRMVLL